MPDKPEEPGPNPQSCDTDCSQSRERGHQGCLGHFQEGQGGIFRYRKLRKVILGLTCFRNFSIVDLSLVKSVDGLSVIGLQGLHCIPTQLHIDLSWQDDRTIIPSNGLLGPGMMRLWLKGVLEGLPGLGEGGCLEERVCTW